MQETITGFAGLEVHAESTTVAIEEAGREAPRFVGLVGAKFATLSKALAKLDGGIQSRYADWPLAMRTPEL